jgi:hypothetical protein
MTGWLRLRKARRRLEGPGLDASALHQEIAHQPLARLGDVEPHVHRPADAGLVEGVFRRLQRNGRVDTVIRVIRSGRASIATRAGLTKRGRGASCALTSASLDVPGCAQQA